MDQLPSGKSDRRNSTYASNVRVAHKRAVLHVCTDTKWQPWILLNLLLDSARSEDVRSFWIWVSDRQWASGYSQILSMLTFSATFKTFWLNLGFKSTLFCDVFTVGWLLTFNRPTGVSRFRPNFERPGSTWSTPTRQTRSWNLVRLTVRSSPITLERLLSSCRPVKLTWWVKTVRWAFPVRPFVETMMTTIKHNGQHNRIDCMQLNINHSCQIKSFFRLSNVLWESRV